MVFLRQMFSLRTLVPKIFTSLSFLWLIIEPIATFKELPNSWYGYFALILVSLLSAILWNWPRARIKHTFKHNDLTIQVIKGDVLTADSNIVVGFCDTFDTEIGKIIRDTSLQGQFQSRVFHGDANQLNNELNRLLQDHSRFAIHDPDKSIGKNLRYPIGTTVPLSMEKRYYLLVYAKMDNDLACKPTSAEDIMTALYELWKSVRRTGQAEPLSMPIIASDLARSGLSRTIIIKMIILTYYTVHVGDPITNELNIFVHPEDIELVDFDAIKSFLKSI